jgi:hypothetical protein
MSLNLESLKLTIRDIVAISGLIVTIMVNYYSLRAEIRDLASTLEGDRKLYELRLQLLEAKVEKINIDIERLKYDNLEKDANTISSRSRSGR